MEKNTVLLSIEKYNELRDFQKKIESGKYLTVSVNGCFQQTQYFYTESEIIAKNIVVIDSLNKKIDDLVHDIAVLKNPSKTQVIFTVNDIKSMSMWDFLKIKKS